jgi:hypothetical protein
MKKQRRWYGNDLNKAVSLFEQGLLIRYISKKKSWQCLYLSNVCKRPHIKYSEDYEQF